jgi:hypothetical protein
MPFWSITARFARTPFYLFIFLLDVPWGGRSCRCCVTLFPLFRSDRFVSFCKAPEYSKRCLLAPITCVSFRFVYLHHTHLMCSLVFIFVLLKVVPLPFASFAFVCLRLPSSPYFNLSPYRDRSAWPPGPWPIRRFRSA